MHLGESESHLLSNSDSALTHSYMLVLFSASLPVHATSPLLQDPAFVSPQIVAPAHDRSDRV